MAGNKDQSQILYVKEGRNSSVAISRWNDGAVYVNVNGHVEATIRIYDMKLQRMVGHLPALLHPDSEIGPWYWVHAGVSAGTFTRYPGIQKITDLRNRAGNSTRIHAVTSAIRPIDVGGQSEDAAYQFPTMPAITC